MNKIKFLNILEAADKLKEKVREWRNTEKVCKFMSTRHIITKEEHFHWIKNLKNKDDRKIWIIFIGKNPIGSVYLQNINKKALSSEWGFYIGEDAYRGRGLGKCILFRFLEMFFDEMKFEILCTKVLSKNIIAINLYNKFNFKEIGRLPFKGQEQTVFLKFSKKDWLIFKNELRNECCYQGKK